MNKKAQTLFDDEYFWARFNNPAILLKSDATILQCNKLTLKLYGLSKPKLIGQNFFTLCRQNNIELTYYSLDEMLRNNTNLSKKTSPLSQIKWTISRYTIQTKEEQLLLVGVDITEFIELTLKEQDITHSIIDTLPSHYIFWKDINSIYLGCNTALAKSLGFNSSKDIIGKSDYDLSTTKVENDAYRADDLDVMCSKKPKLNIEETQTLPDGNKRILSTSKIPLFDDEGQVYGILAIYTDITERKKLELSLAKAKETAEAANIAKTEFIANMSHDIRTPLSGVVGLGSIVERETDNPSTREKVHNMVKSANELLNMLNAILDVVSLGSITVNDIHEEPFALEHLVQRIFQLEQSSVEFRDIKFIKSIDPKIPPILIGDHKKIHHILLNLIGNAIKFTKKGHVSINVKLVEIHHKQVHLLFEVTDTGIGIPPGSLDKIFELFYKATPSYKGLDKSYGLGLNIVKTYTELLGGKITVDSKLNKGSKFCLSLILKIADKNAISKNLTNESLIVVPKTKDKKPTSGVSTAPEILIVEDNTLALIVATSMISDMKCNPTPASDGERALELAITKHFDLILLDIGLPGISGIEFAQQLREHEKKAAKKPVPIIAITGHAEGKIQAECLAAGINEVHIKPIRPEILTELCNKYSLFKSQC